MGLFCHFEWRIKVFFMLHAIASFWNYFLTKFDNQATEILLLRYQTQPSQNLEIELSPLKNKKLFSVASFVKKLRNNIHKRKLRRKLLQETKRLQQDNNEKFMGKVNCSDQRHKSKENPSKKR